jgi:hypothetical protein
MCDGLILDNILTELFLLLTTLQEPPAAELLALDADGFSSLRLSFWLASENEMTAIVRERQLHQLKHRTRIPPADLNQLVELYDAVCNSVCVKGRRETERDA